MCEKNKFEIPLEEYRKKAAPIVAALYEIPCPYGHCKNCPSHIEPPTDKLYVGCMVCRLQERFNPEEAP